jgi:hypothetical protein
VITDVDQHQMDDGHSEPDYTRILGKLAQRSGMQLRSEAMSVTDGLS